MSRIKVLDCTLRDGGYVNNWQFGEERIRYIISGLDQAEIDIVECGYLNQHSSGTSGSTQFSSVDALVPYLRQRRPGGMYVAMVDFGKMDAAALPDHDGTSIDGIRVAFHKHDLDAALHFCQAVKAKGYRLFVQPMVSMNYTDQEFISLIQKVNALEPYAFYIVDSFGVMKRRDLARQFYLVDNNLNQNIQVGYHSHNNLQLAYSNAQALVDIQTNRGLIIDSSIFGMGRGAGNLNTELFVEYLNDSFGYRYDIAPLLQVMDLALQNIYDARYWGYSLPHYLSAINNCHPNYASYLDEKKTLTAERIGVILGKLPQDKRAGYDEAVIEALYLADMSHGKVVLEAQRQVEDSLRGKRVLVIGPGRSCETERETICACASLEDVVTVAINFQYPYCDTDYVFLSNLRRARKLNDSVKRKTIVTSNIQGDGYLMSLQYETLLNGQCPVEDNAGLMLVKYLKQVGVKEVLLAGIDGYFYDMTQNYAEKEMVLAASKDRIDTMNRGMSTVLSQYAKEVPIRFLTTPVHVCIG